MTFYLQNLFDKYIEFMLQNEAQLEASFQCALQLFCFFYYYDGSWGLSGNWLSRNIQ